MIPRWQGFEFNEMKQTPRFVQEAIVEILGWGLRHGGILDPVAPIFAEFCQRAGCRQVLDLGSGTGVPASILVSALKDRGIEPPVIWLSDLIPNTTAMEEAAAQHPEHIRVIPESVDAARVPDKWDQPARTIINVFHHFPDGLATAILADCVAHRRPVFIVEGFKRQWRYLLPMWPSMTVAYFLNPLFARRSRALRAVFTWLMPVIGGVGIHDATVSFLRCRTREELEDMTRPFGDYTWEYREVPYPFGGLDVVFMGWPGDQAA